MKTTVLVEYVRREYRMLIGEVTAEKVLEDLSTRGTREVDVVGRSIIAGVPRTFSLNASEVREALRAKGLDL